MISVIAVKPFCFTEPSLRMHQRFYSCYSSSLNLKLLNAFRRNINFTFLNKFYPKFQPFTFSNNFREQTSKIFRSCSRQCEFVIAHRIRRSQQTFSLYRKLWGDFRLLLILQKFNGNILKHRRLLFTAGLAPCFAWEKQRISEDELMNLEKEIEIAKQLFERESGDHKQDDKPDNLCNCDRCKHLNNDDEWELFYTNVYLKIWRKEHENYKGQGLYVYKVYGVWSDVTAQDFFQVQIDCKYRKEWDQNSVQLYVVDSDTETNSDILYWEFLFPRMFYNRDYVCNRRYKIDYQKKLMTVVSESVEHPACPEKPPVYRVREYWSHIVIKPLEDFEKPGMEFTITYFDNPGLSIPSYIAILYTASGMPDYLMKQKEAAKRLGKLRVDYHRHKELENVPQNPPVPQSQSEKRFLIM